MGDLLRIDLTSRTVTEETIAPELLRDYIGGKGIGTRYLLDEVGPEVAPLSPENKLIFVTGPINGTTMFGSNRYGVHYLSPLTGGYGECTSGGNVAPQFARTGYKVVIVEGAADAPVYLEISEDGGAIHPADDVWGLDTYESEERLVAKHKESAPKAQACVIGPAGENLVRFACVENNKWHSLGRGGIGAVLGSKKLKGLVFHGDKKVELARPDEFKALVKDMAERGKEDAGVAAYRRGGTVNMVRLLNGVNSFPSRYWRTGHLDDIEPLTTEAMRERFWVKNEVCPPCLMQCVKHNRVPDGPHEGLEIDGPEYETIYVFGGLCQIVDFGEVMYLNDICDRLGVDTMTGGNLCALAIEASRRGLIDLELDFGDAEGVAAFLESMCRRDTELGDLFAEGVLTVEKELGLEGVAVHVKGMEPAGYDPRYAQGHGPGLRGHTARRLPPARHLLQGRARRVQRPAGRRGQVRRIRRLGRPPVHHGHAHLLPLLPRHGAVAVHHRGRERRDRAPTTRSTTFTSWPTASSPRRTASTSCAASPPAPRRSCPSGSLSGRPTTTSSRRSPRTRWTSCWATTTSSAAGECRRCKPDWPAALLRVAALERPARWDCPTGRP